MNAHNLAAAGLALAATALIVPSTVHAAQEAPVTVEAPARVEIVSYSDLNLASPSGIKALNGRVRRAAIRLCVDHGVRPLPERLEGRACFDGAMSGAQAQIAEAVSRPGSRQFALLAGSSAKAAGLPR